VNLGRTEVTALTLAAKVTGATAPSHREDHEMTTRTPPGPAIDRRTLIAAGALAGAAAPAASLAAPARATAGDPVRAGEALATAETTAGKVRGCIRRGIHVFKGLPYAESTAGANRFMPPVKPKPWAGVRSSLQFGRVSPQPPRDAWGNDELAWLFSWDDGVQGEDCLRVNVWTPGLADGRRRPVMVWLHGGGFTSGSGQEQPGYDGENLARRGDVVVVSLNHRLGAAGFLNLAALGPRFAHSANLGMLDIVAALEWVRDNIAAFGGDPGSVTIFGQSGGGGKVNTLLAMPAARGLFHRAIVQSGSMLRAGSPEATAAFAQAVMAEAGATPETIQTIPIERLVAAGAALQARARRPGLPDIARMAEASWGPVVDGQVLPRHPFEPDAPPLSAHIPLMVGTTLNEFASATGRPQVEAMTAAEARTQLAGPYGDKAAEMFEAVQRAEPGAKPFDVYSRAATAPIRAAALRQAELKAAQGGAPAYLYWFTWRTPVLDGRPRAFHCAEIAFAFDNVERAANMTGGGPRAQALADTVSDAWIAFARTGDPNHPGLPRWAPFEAGRRTTMILDDACRAVSDPDGVEQRVLASLARA
jgi:para-nitrobenzyl esterase